VPLLLKRPALLLSLWTTAFVALACRSPAPPVAVPEERAAASVPSEPPGPSAPSAPSEEIPEDPDLALARALLAARAAHLAEPQREHLAETLVEVERESGIPALLLVALIEQESRFEPQARGPRGSLGLMQVRPFVGEEVAARIGVPWRGEQTLLDPVANVRIGAGYLAELLERFGTEELALAAYNMGPTRLARRLARGNERTPPFVGRVLRDYEGLQREFASAPLEIGG
jgi:soluble lytic murein transglycosylase-like protein